MSDVGTASSASAHIYLASSFKLVDRIESVCEVLEKNGHAVPDKWWRNNRLADKHPDAGTDAYYDHPEVSEVACQHYQNIQECDVFVLVCPDNEPRKFNGANIELGYAYAHGLDVFAVGALERSAMYVTPEGVPINRVDSMPELVDELRSPRPNSDTVPESDNTTAHNDELGDERECPDCGGRQILQSVQKGVDVGYSSFQKYGEAWICTDTECDRADMHTEGDTNA